MWFGWFVGGLTGLWVVLSLIVNANKQVAIWWSFAVALHCDNGSKKKKKKKKNRPEKFPFIATKNLYCISGPNVCKILFCSEFPVIARKWWTKEEEEEKQLRSVMLLKQTQK